MSTVAKRPQKQPASTPQLIAAPAPQMIAAPGSQLIAVKASEPTSEVQQPQTYYVIHTMPVVSTASTTQPAADAPTGAPAGAPTKVYGLPPAKRPRGKYHKRQRSPDLPRTRKIASKPFSELGDRQKQRVRKEFDEMLNAFCERHKIEDKADLCDKYCPTKLQKKLTGDETYQLQTKLKFSGKTMNKLRSILNGHGCNVFASKRAVKIIEERILAEHADLREGGEVDIDEHIEVDGDTSGELDVDVDEEIEVDESPDMGYDDEEHYEEEALEGDEEAHEYEVNTSDEYVETPMDYVDVGQVQ
uniref:Histone-fold-containing protein n=1 Tax=Panagrellus redivivus TaxID=6233 RepID=A0A7E4VI85_PANRE